VLAAKAWLGSRQTNDFGSQYNNKKILRLFNNFKISFEMLCYLRPYLGRPKKPVAKNYQIVVILGVKIARVTRALESLRA
jgi:hypothetical protein